MSGNHHEDITYLPTQTKSRPRDDYLSETMKISYRNNVVVLPFLPTTHLRTAQKHPFNYEIMKYFMPVKSKTHLYFSGGASSSLTLNLAWSSF